MYKLTPQQIIDLQLFSEIHPKSICYCGHTGDGGNSSHLGAGPAAGHGLCVDCSCEKFNWRMWTTEYMTAFAKITGLKLNRSSRRKLFNS